MKKIRRCCIAFALFLFSINTGRAQLLLSNTYWIDYDSSNVFSFYWHFDNNTLSGCIDGITYSPTSGYIEYGSSFLIVDIAPSTCSATDTGHYTFSIQNDTLRFTIAADACTPRSGYLSSHYFVAQITGLESEHSFSTLQVHPNPFNDQLNFTSANEPLQIRLYDITGRIIFNQSVQGSKSLNTSQLAKGIYFYDVRNDRGVIKQGKVVKE
ncbi:MAG: T9SS type A sorting domain-containing protein [Bacteroidia bacterium]